ncbi:MAG: hypothetical protein ACFE0I_23550 [Elainellaceae cyanobacterium]
MGDRMMARLTQHPHRLISWLVAVSAGCLGFWVGNPLRQTEAEAPCQSPRVSTVCNDQAGEYNWAERSLSSLIFAFAGGGIAMLIRYAQKTRTQTHSPTAQTTHSRSDRLSGLASSPQPLTNRQREVLQCLLVLAAIAPDAENESSVLSVAKQSTLADAPPIVPRFEQDSFQYLTLSEMHQILSTFGFSDWAIHQAWRIICKR